MTSTEDESTSSSVLSLSFRLTDSSSSESLSESSSTDESDDELIVDSDNSRPPSPSPPSSTTMNESPERFIVRRRLPPQRRRPEYMDSDVQTDDDLTVSMVSSASDSNPPSPTVSTFMIHENTDSVFGDEQFDSDATTMASSPVRQSSSRASIVSIASDGDNSRDLTDPPDVEEYSPEPLGEDHDYDARSPVLSWANSPNPPLDEEPENEAGADQDGPEVDDNVPQPINDIAAIPQEALEPVVENVEAVNKTGSHQSQVTNPVLNSSVVSEADDNSLCSICMDPLTNSGKHRVVCLRCGHIFGHSCLERWISVGCTNGAKRCPTCNKRACLRDIRILYLPKVVPLDTVEKDRLIKEKEELTAQKNVIELELSKCKLQRELSVRNFEERVSKLEKELSEAKQMFQNLAYVPNKKDVSAKKSLSAELLHSVELCKEGGCRVLAYSPLLQELVVSQPSGNTLFAGFGIRVLNSVDFQPSRYVFLHSKMIRDLAFHPEDRNLLLSVSLDHSAKLVDLNSCTTVHTFKVGEPLWSCCWDASNYNLMLVGSQFGRVCQYDRRMTDSYINTWSTTDNLTPVVSLASVPSVAKTPFPQGGFLSCRLNGVFAYARHGNYYNCQELQLNGPFMSMRYDPANQNILTSARPSSTYSKVRISLNLVDADKKGNVCLPEIHTFNCGSSARCLSRFTTVPMKDDSLVVAHHESGRTLNMWSSKTGNLLQSIPIREPVIDLANMCFSNRRCLFASLSEKKVCIYKVT